MALSKDASSPALASAGPGTLAQTATTASFSPPANALLIARTAANNPVAGQDTTLTVSGGGLTWTRQVRKNKNAGSTGGAGTDGGVEIWTADTSGGAPGSITVSAAIPAGQGNTGWEVKLLVDVWTDTAGSVPAIGNVAAASSASGLPSVGVNTSAGSQVLAVSSDWATLSGQTLGSAQTDDTHNLDANFAWHFWRLTVVESSAQSPRTMNMTAPSGQQYNLAVLEVQTTGSSESTGEVFPTAGASVSEAPWSSDAWVTPGNVTADDGSTASVTAATYDSGDQTTVLKATGFDFSSIPAGATIDGVTVRINAWETAGGGNLNLVQLLDTSGAKVGTNKGAGTNTLTTTTSDVFTFGGAGDKWGNALDVAWVKDPDFGVAIGITATAANSDVFVDYVTVEVTYTDNPPADPYGAEVYGTSGLVAYWRLGDAGSTAVDLTGGNDGTYTGSPSTSSSLVVDGDQCHDFNGSSQYVAIAGSSSLQPSNVTVEAWINADTLSGPDRVVTLANDCFGLFIEGSVLKAFFWNGSVNRITAGATTLSASTTYHVAASWDGTDLVVWLNGVSDGTNDYSGQSIGWDATTTSAIASSSGGTSSLDLDARIDEVAVYNVAVPGATLLSHYETGAPAGGAAPTHFLSSLGVGS